MVVKKVVLSVMLAFFLSILYFSSAFADAAKGEALFNDKQVGNCKTCHNITDKNKVGPGLQGVMGRHKGGRAFLVKWIRDPKGMWDSDDPDIKEMKTRLGREGKPLRMKPKGQLTEEQANDLVDYLETLK